MTAVLLFLVSCVTSAVAGIFGLGGGMLLIALLPFLLPAAVVVPLHSVAQISSNASRAWMAYKSILWQYFPMFVLGSLLGLAVFGWLLSQINIDYMPVFIALYILFSQWSQAFNRFIRRWENFYIIGALQTGFGLLVGATGPLTTTLLQKLSSDKEHMVATNAIMMLFTHICKISIFALIGLSLINYWLEAMLLIAGAVTGSWLGTQFRRKIEADNFKVILKWILTVLASVMLIRVLLLVGL